MFFTREEFDLFIAGKSVAKNVFFVVWQEPRFYLCFQRWLFLVLYPINIKIFQLIVLFFLDLFIFADLQLILSYY